MNCFICFDRLIDRADSSSNRTQAIHCSNKLCRQVICVACIKNLISESVVGHHLPVCVREGCGGIYLPRSLPNDASLVAHYAQAIRQFYSDAQSVRTIRPKVHTELIETIRRSRRVYAWDRFPRAIAFVASIAMPSDLANVKRAQAIENNAVVAARAYCSNYGCNGLRDTNDQCNACGQLYCSRCDQRLVPGHGKICGQLHDDQAIITKLLERTSSNAELTSSLRRLQECRAVPPNDGVLITLIKRQKVSTMSREKQDRDLLQSFDSLMIQLNNYHTYNNLIDWLVVSASSTTKTLRTNELKVVIDAYLSQS